VAVIVRMLAGRGPHVTVAAADLFAGGWVALTIIAFLTQNVVLRDFVPLTASLFGLRDAAFFVIFYFVGRATPEIAEDDRMARRAFTVLLVTCVVAIAEQLFVTPQMLVLLGVGSYVRDFLGTAVFTQGNVYGLPDNYWSLMGSHLVRRSGSVFLSSQAFALIFVIFLPAATLWLLSDQRGRKFYLYCAYALIWTGLAVTFTRAAIAIGVAQVVFILAARRRLTGVALMATTGLVLFLVALAAVPGLSTFALETVTWQTGSSQSHIKDWLNGVTAFLQQPWGYGLGTTDQSAVRGGLVPITADNLYLKYAVELGVPGLVALVGTLGCFVGAGRRLAIFGETENERTLGFTIALATLGIAFYGMTSVMFGDPLVSYLLFWLGGATVTLSQRTERAHVLALAYA
ncbi:MAG TPA: O-antigen ligase family protein, partial [Gemmatimonadaceae bacterium]